VKKLPLLELANLKRNGCEETVPGRPRAVGRKLRRDPNREREKIERKAAERSSGSHRSHVFGLRAHGSSTVHRVPER